jgi:hypothetical protein
LRIKGKVEVSTPTTVGGWIAAFGVPEDRVRLELLLDGVAIAVAPADGFRSDVAALGFGDGACGFQFQLAEPLTVAEAERLQLRIVGSDLCLELPREPSSSAVTNTTPRAVRAPDAGAGTGDEKLKVFVVGSPRSGTSVLLRAMQTVFGLRAHGESHVMPGVAQAVFHLRSYYRRFKDESGDLLIRQLPIDRIEAPLLEGIRAFYDEIYEGEGWADKTPSDEAMHSAPLIRRIFPDARLIVSRRNGIEVVASYRRKFGATFRDACENWARVMEGIAVVRQQCPDILEVDQFDLANASDTVGCRIAGYLGRPDLGATLAAFLASNREDRLSTHDWRQRLTLDDMDWTDDERDDFLRICGPLMRVNNYATHRADR